MDTTGSSSSGGATESVPSPSADLVVGLPAAGRTEAEVADAVRAAANGLAAAGNRRARIVVAAPGTPQEIEERVRGALDGEAPVTAIAYAGQPSDAIALPYHGMMGRARALHAILDDANRQGARACVVVDPRSAAAGTEIDQMAAPVLNGAAEFATPVYARHPFAGALVHGIVYPLFRTLYGARLRSPLAGDFACARPFIDAVLGDPIWESDAGQIGIDLWLPTTAASEGFRLGETLLAPQPDRRPDADLETTVSQVVGFLFTDMERRASVWQRIRGSRPVPRLGSSAGTPAAPDVDAAALADSLRLGSRELQDIWTEVLPPLSILQWRRVAAAPLESFRVDDALWARTVYDFAMGHRLRVIARDHLLRSLAPLYLGWLASFVVEMRDASAQDAEARLERLCQVFEAEKPYLISQWRWPARFRPVKRRQ